jgi:hypothetical protein
MLAGFQNFNSDESHRLELQKITDLVQARLFTLQNPISCSNARLFIILSTKITVNTFRFLVCQFWIKLHFSSH